MITFTFNSLHRNMQALLDKIQTLKASEVKNHVDARITEFSQVKTQPIYLIFKELCFCITTANCSAERCIEVHE